jgi:hypothetical protein
MGCTNSPFALEGALIIADAFIWYKSTPCCRKVKTRFGFRRTQVESRAEGITATNQRDTGTGEEVVRFPEFGRNTAIITVVGEFAAGGIRVSIAFRVSTPCKEGIAH